MTQHHPVLFLDIDGVILSGEELWASGNNRYLPPQKIALLNWVCLATNCDVVISSTWRRDEGTPMALKEAGFCGRLHTDWRTNLGFFGGDPRRGGQIAEWLKAHPKVPRYAILDDDGDMLEEQRPSFVQPRFATGLQRAHCERLINLLNGTVELAPHLWPEVYDPRERRAVALECCG